LVPGISAMTFSLMTAIDTYHNDTYHNDTYHNDT